MAKIVVIIQGNDEEIAPHCWEAIQFGSELAESVKGILTVVVLGTNSERAAEGVAESAGIDVVSVCYPARPESDPAVIFEVIDRIVRELEPDLLVFPGITDYLEFAARLAVIFDADCISYVCGFEVSDGNLVFRRKIFNGKFEMEIVPEKDTSILLVQPGAFPWKEQVRSPGKLAYRYFETTVTSGIRTQQIESLCVNNALMEAAVVVAAGRGIGKRENLALLEETAALFIKATIAGSRPICDAQWLPYSQQVGQTGAIISPELYLALGISGAQQHLMGMRSSKFVVAVNNDPNAPIFNEADVGIIADAVEFLEAFLDAAETK